MQRTLFVYSESFVVDTEREIVIGVPCSAIDLQSEVPCTREDEAVAFACGVQLGGKRTKVFMQNSGIGTSLDTMTSLYYPYGFDFDFIIAPVNEPLHHKLMGKVGVKIWRMIKDEANRCY